MKLEDNFFVKFVKLAANDFITFINSFTNFVVFFSIIGIFVFIFLSRRKESSFHELLENEDKKNVKNILKTLEKDSAKKEYPVFFRAAWNRYLCLS